MTLQFTNNSLHDIIRLLKEGHIVCMHDNITYNYYNKTETLDQITDQMLIYIDISKMASLMDPEEWPWYIHNYGFVEYKSIHILPQTQESMIHYCKL